MVYKSKYMLFLYFSIATVSTRKVAEVVSVKSVDREFCGLFDQSIITRFHRLISDSVSTLLLMGLCLFSSDTCVWVM